MNTFKNFMKNLQFSILYNLLKLKYPIGSQINYKNITLVVTGFDFELDDSVVKTNKYVLVYVHSELWYDSFKYQLIDESAKEFWSELSNAYHTNDCKCINIFDIMRSHDIQEKEDLISFFSEVLRKSTK